MIRVTFSQAIVIEESKLPDLLRATGGNPATVEYLGDAVPAQELAVVPARRGRRPKSMSDEPAPVQTGKRRGRKSNAQKAAEAAEAAAAAAADAPAEAEAETPPAEEAAPADPPAEVDDKKEAAAAKKAAAAEAAAAKKAAAAEAAAAKKDAKKPASDSGIKVDADALLSRFSVLIDKDFESAKGILDGFGVNRFSELSPEQHAEFAGKLDSMGV